MVVVSTFRQELVAQKITENGGKNLGKAMLAAGYAPSTARSPNKNLKSSKAWPQVIQRYLPDIVDAQIHQQLMEAVSLETLLFSQTVDDEMIRRVAESVKGSKMVAIIPERKRKRCYYVVPDFACRSKALEKSFKLKNRYPKEKAETEASDELRQEIARMSEFMREATQRKSQ